MSGRMNSITVDGITYNLPPVVMDILIATADERDRYRDALSRIATHDISSARKVANEALA